MMKRGFTLVELLVVIAIIGILASIALPAYVEVKKSAYTARAKAELRSIAQALQMYAFNDNAGRYPPDVNRDLPPGLEKYLSVGNWPKAPWPGSNYDWDNWSPSALTYNPKQQVYQISIRFCPIGDPANCKFPNESWAAGFDENSAFYYCIEGPCRSHAGEPYNHPGYCVNCPTP